MTIATETTTIRPEDVQGDFDVPAADLPHWASMSLVAIAQEIRAGRTVTITSSEEELTPAQMADDIGISRAGIQRRIAAGEIGYRKVGNRYRIRRSEVERFRAAYIREMATALADDF
ncbi:helix-turn-helix domain-containing protein [Mycobacteroides franklinii]|uniref:helix-turn-helix domain-containing protein n=1 Tax=Mycobacteroides franklinii TaxID=948102 RepID=UPI000992E525|nr:helix-turn-helix domain-containing protein [Mycobacteroides franklinii]